LILAILIFNIYFWLYLYSQQKQAATHWKPSIENWGGGRFSPRDDPEKGLCVTCPKDNFLEKRAKLTIFFRGKKK
jgi:hypothetical protein